MLRASAVRPHQDNVHKLVIRNYDPACKDSWDEFVRSNPAAGYGHLSANFSLATDALSARNRSILLLDSNAQVLAVMPLFEIEVRELRRIPVRVLQSGLFFPAGPLFRAELGDKARQSALDHLIGYVMEMAQRARVDQISIGYPGTVGEELAISHFGYSPLRQYGFRERNVVSLVLDLRRDVETLARGRDENCRRCIRNAEKNGAVVRILTDRREWLSCHELNVQTMGKLAFGSDTMEGIWDSFIGPGIATAFASHTAHAIASVIVSIHCNRSSYFWLGFNRKPEQIRGTSHQALWQAILHARERGDSFFELGSKEFINPKQMGISRFKESFGGMGSYDISGVLEMRPAKRLLLDFLRLGSGKIRKWFHAG